MRASRFALLLAAGLLLFLSQPAQAVTLELHHSKAKTALAAFESTSGCIDEGVFVIARDLVVGTDQRLGVKEVVVPKDHPSDLLLEVFRFDHCTDTQLTDAFVQGIPLADSDFQIADDLSSASLNTTVSLINNVDNIPFSAVVDIDWTATGPATRESGLQLKDTFPGQNPFVIRIGDSATLRDAQAAGSVTVGGANLAPDPSVEATLLSGVFYFQAIGTFPG